MFIDFQRDSLLSDLSSMTSFTFDVINRTLTKNVNDSINMSIFNSLQVSTLSKKRTFNSEQYKVNTSYMNSITHMIDPKLNEKLYTGDNNKIKSIYPDFDEFLSNYTMSPIQTLAKKDKQSSLKNSINNSELKVIKIGKKEVYSRNNSNESKHSNNTIKLNKDNFQIGVNIRFHSPPGQKPKIPTSKNSPIHSVHKSPPNNNRIIITNKNSNKPSSKIPNKSIPIKQFHKPFAKAFSPKPSSPTEMHNEMKSNGFYIKKSIKNQSLALNSNPRNMISCDSPFSDQANDSINQTIKSSIKKQNNNNTIFAKKINKGGLNRTIRKNNITPPPMKIRPLNNNKMRFKRDNEKLNLSFDEIIPRKKKMKKEKKGNDIRSKTNLNKSYDNLKMENSVFEDDDIFKILDNTQIIIPKNHLDTYNNNKGKKLEIIRENSENDLIQRGEDGERITANFMKNDNLNGQMLFDRFSFHNHNLH